MTAGNERLRTGGLLRELVFSPNRLALDVPNPLVKSHKKNAQPQLFHEDWNRSDPRGEVRALALRASSVSVLRGPAPSCGPRRPRRRCGASGRGRTSPPAGSRRTRRPPPCTWIARSITQVASSAAATLIAEISTRALSLPTVSIIHAAFRVRRRVCSMRTRDSAIQSRITPCFDKRDAERDA